MCTGQEFHLFSAVLLGREFGADAVDFDVYAGVSSRVPLEGEGVEAARVPDGLDDAVAQGNVDVQDSFSGMLVTPLGDLLGLHVLQTTLVETDPNLSLEHSLPEARDIAAELLEREFVGLTLVDVGYGRFGHLQKERGCLELLQLKSSEL